MAIRDNETAGEVYERADDAVCHWCGRTTDRYANARLVVTSKINKDVVLRDHVICADCHPKVAKGIQDAAKNRVDAREIKPTKRIERAGSSDYRRWEAKE